MVKIKFINIFIFFILLKCYNCQYLSTTPLVPSQIIQNAYDLSLKIESLSNDITEYLTQLNNNSCSGDLLNNVHELYKNVSNVLNDMNEKQKNISSMGDEINKIKDAAVCMKNSMCVQSPTQSIPTVLSTLKPFDNTSCDQLNQNGIISNGNTYENINCQWNINTKISKYISLTINFLYIKGNSSLVILDKLNGNETIYNYSLYKPIVLSSYSNNYQISIISEDSYSGTSFKLSYITNDVCYENYCQNNGTCIVKPDNTPTCQCIGCFQGNNCNEPLDICKSYTKCLQNVNPKNICKNEGTINGCVAKCYCDGSNTSTPFCRK